MTVSQADRRFLTTVEGVPASPSPISNAVVVGSTCWISGQLSVAEDGRYQPGTAYEEAERAFELVFRIAEAAGFGRGDLVYVDLAFQDLDDLAEVNQLYGLRASHNCGTKCHVPALEEGVETAETPGDGFRAGWLVAA